MKCPFVSQYGGILEKMGVILFHMLPNIKVNLSHNLNIIEWEKERKMRTLECSTDHTIDIDIYVITQVKTKRTTNKMNTLSVYKSQKRYPVT